MSAQKHQHEEGLDSRTNDNRDRAGTVREKPKNARWEQEKCEAENPGNNADAVPG
jgi:hypothetical protein